ncbi:MAG: IPT/TIG domain-containing protein [Caldilineaceae bacterium]|nr:IPT/TIG domain-containing protein [Caldilineaceae bacterium]
MIRSLDFRFPGILFLPAQPEPQLPLPRLDVAAFVGFAERGPLHLPVAVEDINTYTAVFGGDLPLAQETGGRTVYANLPRTVASFFANGGRRCYVVRVAGREATAARFRLPGMAALGGNDPRLAAISASSPGAWGNQVRLATRLNVTPLSAAAFDLTSATVDSAILRRGDLPDLASGDLLRLAFDDGSRWLARIEIDDPGAATSPIPGLPAPPLDLHLTQIHRLLDDFAVSPPAVVERLERVAIDGISPLASVGPLVADGEATILPLDPADQGRVRAGEMVRFFLADGPAEDRGYLARIAEIRAVNPPDSPPAPAFEIRFGDALHLTPASLPTGLQTVELLRMDMAVRLGNDRLPVMTDLAFGAPHPRFWGDAVLLGSSRLHRRSARRRHGEDLDPVADAANWFRTLIDDPYDVTPFPGERPAQRQPSTPTFAPADALAGLLAPVGSSLGLSPTDATDGDPFVRAAAELDSTFWPVGMAEQFDLVDPTQFRPPERDGSDDLGAFDASNFYDPYLAPPGAPGRLGPGESQRTLMQTAFDLHYLRGRRLRGLHSLLFIDEVALISAPDAVHHPWEGATPSPSTPPPLPALQPQPDCPPQDDFSLCASPPSIHAVDPHYGQIDAETSVTIHGEGFTEPSEMRVLFGARPTAQVQVQSSTQLTALAPTGMRLGPIDVTVENTHGSAVLVDGFTYTRAATAPSLPVVMEPGIFDLVEDEPFLAIHQTLIYFCQARGDVMTILSLPLDYTRTRALEWQQALRRRLGLPSLNRGFVPAEPTEIADLSFAAIYHPWPLVADATSSDSVRPIPPDGAICGLIATRERRRQVWVAPANLPLVDGVGLHTDLSDDDWADLFARGFNLLRAEANDFRPMSAHTLSRERSLMQISVRRLLILVRKAAIRLGLDFVFESNHEIFREGVRVTLEEMLRFLYERGAFAGRTEEQSFRVTTDASVNPPQSVDAGRFIAVIQVAPSQPMEFISVQLTRRGEGELSATEI